METGIQVLFLLGDTLFFDKTSLSRQVVIYFDVKKKQTYISTQKSVRAKKERGIRKLRS